MPTINIDKEVYENLKKKAEGFDTPNAVIRRILGLPSSEEVRKKDEKDQLEADMKGARERYREYIDVDEFGNMSSHSFDPNNPDIKKEYIKTSEEMNLSSHGSRDKSELPKGLIKVTYENSRLCFLREKIDPLNSNDAFQIKTHNDGTFIFTKDEFEKTFENVIQSRSYREKGIYHYPTPPSKALRFRIK